MKTVRNGKRFHPFKFHFLNRSNGINILHSIKSYKLKLQNPFTSTMSQVFRPAAFYPISYSIYFTFLLPFKKFKMHTLWERESTSPTHEEGTTINVDVGADFILWLPIYRMLFYSKIRDDNQSKLLNIRNISHFHSSLFNRNSGKYFCYYK